MSAKCAKSVKMNANVKQAFSHIKPVCDLVMVSPTPEKIATFLAKVSEMKSEAVQELQQYILFPFITHIKSKESRKKYELQIKMVDAMREVLIRVTITSFEMCMKIESALMSLVFDNSKPGMVADGPEELKLSVMQCLTTLMLQLDREPRECMLKTQVPSIAQAVFVSVHIAKLEKLRTLRLAAINCLKAHTGTHQQFTDDKYHIPDANLELLIVDTLANILPGVLAALQDVATDTNNPGHAVIVAALEATHRILCITMHDKHMPRRPELTPQDFARLMVAHTPAAQREVSKDKKPKFLPKRSLDWYNMAGEKISLVMQSLSTLSTHEHPKVRKELAVMCCRILDECYQTMQPSISVLLDVLISLSKDDFPEISEYCNNAVTKYMSGHADRHKTIDEVCDNFFDILNSLPRILNNIDSARKLSTLNLLHGYIQLLCDDSRPQRLTTALSQHHHMQSCCDALRAAAALEPLASLAQHAARDVLSPPPPASPWCKLRHMDPPCETRFQEILRLLGGAECAELLADTLLEMFLQDRTAEIVYLLNGMAAAAECPANLVKRVLNTYIDPSTWHVPLEVGGEHAPLTAGDTRDVRVYNPRAWTKESVPDLYEGAVETRYTDITYRCPRAPPPAPADSCGSLAAAQRNMVLSCLLTAGVGTVATRLREHYQPFLMKTLCLVLERVGSKYEMLHLAGLKAINEVAIACGHASVAELIRENADYFTNQVTVRLKKAWNSQSALQILSVVMEYSDASILDCLYGIVEDVLVQSCDKYYEKNLYSYLQVFLTFVNCIQKWFPIDGKESNLNNKTVEEIDILKDVIEYENNIEESERLLDSEEFEKETGKSVEEMYKEDQKEKEDNLLDYDDRVTNEKPPLPQHIRVTQTILDRCINFVTSSRRDHSLLALQVVTAGLQILSPYEDELLPCVHRAWPPLVSRFDGQPPAVVRAALQLLLTMATLAKDFITRRTIKEVLPQMLKYLQSAAAHSHLQDAGSAYRSSQAYSLQAAALEALPALVRDLRLTEHTLTEAMATASLYLSKKQPKPLQALGVQFFKSLLDYDYGATWHYLRKLCNNDVTMPPPAAAAPLAPVVGSPYESSSAENEANIKLIWNLV